jgi:rhamnosyl/mannosyltransferase
VSETIDGVPVLKAGRIATIASAPLSLELFRQMGRFQPDVAHLHFPYPIGEIAYLTRGRARRLVVTYHSDIVRQRVLGALYRPFWRRLLERADAISLSNPSYLRHSTFVAPHAAKCVVIHHGQNLSRFAPTPRMLARAAELRAALGEPLILFVGKLRYYKGVEILIQATESVPVPARTIIVGDGPMASEWQRLAESRGLAQRVVFTGAVSDEDLPAYYHASSLFVLPSTYQSETWGAVQIEAMASGLPCVCTELGTGTSYVNRDGETGFVVPPHNPDALAAAITRLLGDAQLRARMGTAARQRAAAEFSHETMIDRTLSLYRSLFN